MRDLPWKLFTLTGDIEAYMLYKEHQELGEDIEDDDLAEDLDLDDVQPN